MEKTESPKLVLISLDWADMGLTQNKVLSNAPIVSVLILPFLPNLED